MKNLAELQAKCNSLGIKVETKGRASKEPYIAALRDHHWQKDHPGEPLAAQIMPMLLGSWEDLDEEEAAKIEADCHEWIVQPKLDGVRALLHVENGRVRITSRTVSEVTYRLSEFQDNLPHLGASLAPLEGITLDGELVCPVSGLNTGNTIAATPLQATTAILSTSPENARQIQDRQNAHVLFHVFDVLRLGGVNVTSACLVDRQEFLAMVMRALTNPFLEALPSYSLNKSEIHRRMIDAGGEGTVWKKADAPYEPGRRVNHWIKRKRGIKIEAFVTGFIPGTNGHIGLVGAVEFGVRQVNGSIKPIAWVSSWSDEERRNLTHRGCNSAVELNPRYLGRKATLYGQDLSVRSQRLQHARLQSWAAS